MWVQTTILNKCTALSIGSIINMMESIILVNVLQFRGQNSIKQSFSRILFIQRIRKVEDDYTTYKVYLQADKIAYMNKAIYIHRKRSTSVTRTVNLADVYPLKSIEERLTILNLIGAPQELLDKEIQAYKWRLSIHEEESLKRRDMEAYLQILVKKAIETKRG